MDPDSFSKEPQAVANYWKNILSKTVKEPTFKNTIIYLNLDGNSGKVCGLYIVHNDQEFCYLCSQKVLDENTDSIPNHIKAMERFVREGGKGEALKGEKLNYVIGFYYDKTECKYNSCANIWYSKSRQASSSDEQKIKEKFEKWVADKLNEHDEDSGTMVAN